MARGDEVADADAARQPSRRLGVPERVVAMERRAKGSDSVAVGEAARAAAGLGGIPLARVLRDDVVEVHPAQACISTRTWPTSVKRSLSKPRSESWPRGCCRSESSRPCEWRPAPGRSGG
jgi:hypothetical protein